MESIEEYVAQFDGVHRDWIMEYTQYMKEKHPDVPACIWFRMPTYKVDCFYIAFSVTQKYFAVHTNDSECFDMLRNGLDKASFGKRSAKIKYTDEGAKHVIYNTIEFFVFKYLGVHPGLDEEKKIEEEETVDRNRVINFPQF